MSERTRPLPAFVEKIRLGRTLVALRDQAQLGQAAAAEHLGCHQTKITNIETGVNTPVLADLEKLLDLYKADQVTRARCIELAKLGGKRSGRKQLRSRFVGPQQTLVDLEASADTMWQHSAMLIPGLVQTEAYMRYIQRAYRPSQKPDLIAETIANRKARQAVLDNADEKFWFLIDEAALRRMDNIEGSSAIMLGQLAHLIDLIDRPNIEIQVVPFHRGYYMGQEEDYTVFGFGHEGDADSAVPVVYMERYDGGEVLHNEKAVNRFLATWDHQRAVAEGPEQSRDFLWEVTRSLK